MAVRQWRKFSQSFCISSVNRGEKENEMLNLRRKPQHYNTYMEITGKIIAALPERSGTSNRTGNTWKSQEFVIETHEQYPRKCVFTVFGEDRLREMNITVGAEMTVSFDIDAHEYNGRWFNDIRAWRAVPATAPAPAAAAPAAPAAAPAASAAPAPAPSEDPFATAAGGGNDDLPF